MAKERKPFRVYTIDSDGYNTYINNQKVDEVKPARGRLVIRFGNIIIKIDNVSSEHTKKVPRILTTFKSSSFNLKYYNQTQYEIVKLKRINPKDRQFFAKIISCGKAWDTTLRKTVYWIAEEYISDLKESVDNREDPQLRKPKKIVRSIVKKYRLGTDVSGYHEYGSYFHNWGIDPFYKPVIFDWGFPTS